MPRQKKRAGIGAGSMWQLPWQHTPSLCSLPFCGKWVFWAQDWFGSICCCFRPIGCQSSVGSHAFPSPCCNELYLISKWFPQTFFLSLSLYVEMDRCYLTFFSLFTGTVGWSGEWDKKKQEPREQGALTVHEDWFPDLQESPSCSPWTCFKGLKAHPERDPLPAVRLGQANEWH